MIRSIVVLGRAGRLSRAVVALLALAALLAAVSVTGCQMKFAGFGAVLETQLGESAHRCTINPETGWWEGKDCMTTGQISEQAAAMIVEHSREATKRREAKEETKQVEAGQELETEEEIAAQDDADIREQLADEGWTPEEIEEELGTLDEINLHSSEPKRGPGFKDLEEDSEIPK